MKKITFTVLLLVLLVSVPAEAVFLDDFLVNTDHRIGPQGWCRIGVDGYGNFYITYVAADDTTSNAVGFVKKYNANGNLVAGPVQVTPASLYVEEGGMITVQQTGKLVVTWGLTPYPIYVPKHPYAQMLNSQLSPITPLFRADPEFDSLDSYNGAVMDVGMDQNANFTLIWRLSETNEAYYKRFDSLGTPLCASTRTSDYTQEPMLGVADNGKFVLALTARIFTPHSTTYPLAKVFDGSGTPILNQVMITCDGDTIYPNCATNVDTCLVGDFGDVALQENGNLMYVFSGCDDNEPFLCPYGRVFDSLGNPVSEIFKVNTENTNTDFNKPIVVTDGRGGYLVALSDSRYSPYYNGRRDLFLQRYDQLGNPIGMNFRVNNVLGSKATDRVNFGIACDGERVYVVWRDGRDPYTWDWDIYAEVIDLDLVGTYVLGDANFDQKITLSDVIFAVNYIFKGKPLPEGDVLVADVNGDCQVSLVDVIYEVNYIFGKGPPFVPGCLP